MYLKGVGLSKRMKFVPFWDSWVEPYIVRQVGVLFAGGSGFIDGLVSDNDNRVEIEMEIAEMQQHVVEELEILRGEQQAKLP